MQLSVSPRLGLDMGTGKTALWAGQRIAWNEPTLLIVESGHGKVLHSGAKAAERAGRTKQGTEILRPVRRGAIADYAAAVFLLRKVVSQAMRMRLLKPVIFAAAPIQLSSVESRALRDAAKDAGAGGIFIVPCNLASLWDAHDKPDEPSGTLIVDIGAGVTDISVIASNQIITGRTVKLGGDDITELARRVMELGYGVRMSRNEAERLKIDIGVAQYKPDDVIEKLRAEPGDESKMRKVSLQKSQVSDFLLKGIEPLFTGILQTLEETPPELFEDIFNRGVMLTGGSSLLPGLGVRMKERIQLKINRLPDPSQSVIRGLGKAIKRFPRYEEFFRRGEIV